MTADFSSDAFIKFLNDDKNFKDADQSILHNMKGTANRLMLNVEKGEFSDIRDAQPEALIKRHLEATGVTMSHNSQLTYRSRLNRAINMFIKHQNEQLGLPTEDSDLVSKQSIQARVVANKKKISSVSYVKPDSIESENSSVKDTQLPVADKTGAFSIPVLIRPASGVIVQLDNVPMDLTVEEADHIASILKLYARKA